ncbi:MAG: alanine racemase [Actinomycetes bacterium]
MTFTLYVDGDRWRAHTESVRARVREVIHTEHGVDGDLVPVIKGNGYGLGNRRLADEAARLGLTRIAVGTVFEAQQLAGQTEADILVLTPFEPADRIAASAWSDLAESAASQRITRTVSSRASWDVLAAGPGPVRVVLEGLTSMGRFGLTPDELRDLLLDPSTIDALAQDRIRLEGLALHLPLVQPSIDHRAIPGSRWHDAGVGPASPPKASARVVESWRWGLGWQAQLADLTESLTQSLTESNAPTSSITALTSAAAVWTSHLDDSELAVLRSALPDIALFARTGTRLWLGDRGALRARGTVLAVHLVPKGDASGYRQRRSTRAGAIAVVGGGTAHGVALQAPSPLSSARQRIRTAGAGILEAGGRSLSPFYVGGAQRWFVEPPHMQVSLIALPQDTSLPAVGTELDVDVRLTIAHPDRVIGLD